MKNLPEISNYSDNPRNPNTTRIDTDDYVVWYSYTTPVAFLVHGQEKVVRENEWSNTTGKHLNMIDGGDKKSRVDSETFQELWKEQMGATEPVPSL